MTLNVDDINERVDDLEDELADYRTAAEKWEDMWALKAWDDTPEEALTEKNQERVTVPSTYNTVHLARRLISVEPRIEVPSSDANTTEDQAATRRSRWLNGFWQRANKEQRRLLIADAAWQALVRGRFCFEVSWVYDTLPPRLKERRLPILVRTLDPMNVGVRQGPLWTEFAYHKYSDRLDMVAQRHRELNRRSRKLDNRKGRDEVDVVDAWWTDPSEGDIWHAVVVEDEFALSPRKTKLLDIPIVLGYGDSAPVDNEELRSLSILAPLNGVWQYHCRLASQVGTALLFYFWPAITVQNEHGFELADFDVTPGTTTQLPWGTRVDMHRGDVNVPLAREMLGMIDAMEQQSTFPQVLWGDAGQVTAGYGINLLADSARGRVNIFRENLESAIEHVNEIALGMVETLADSKGVKVWARSEKSGEIYHEVLTAKDIKGFYENLVSLVPQVPQDDMQKQTLGMQMVEKGIMSKRTFRDRQANISFPDDEADRVLVERTWEDPAFAPKRALQAFQESYPDSWREVIADTPLEQIAQQQERPEMMPPGAGPMPPGMMPPGAGPMPPGMMPPGVQIPGVMGVPPEGAGQVTPEMLGLPPGAPPGMFQELTGQPLTEEEILRRQLNLPPNVL